MEEAAGEEESEAGRDWGATCICINRVVLVGLVELGGDVVEVFLVCDFGGGQYWSFVECGA